MKSFNHLYETAKSEKTRRESVHKVCLGRNKMRGLERYSKDEEETSKLALDWIENYHNATHHPIIISEGVKHKKRKIIVPTFQELTVQHCCVTALMPMFRKGMYEHTYASIPNRGAHKAKRFIEKWVREDAKNCMYILKMDIRHFFDSIPHDKLKAMLAKYIHDKKMLDLICEIVDVTDKGLPLGFYTSQWLANWYLQGLDHYIKEELQAVHYVRYMDDMVVFGSNKKKLHKTREAIEKYLRERLGLKLKDNWQVFRFDYIKNGKHYGRDLDFMGFRFFRNRTVLRRSIMLKATRKAKRIRKKGRATIYDVRQMLSYLGWIDCTDTYQMYKDRIRPYVDVSRYKRRISEYDKRQAG